MNVMRKSAPKANEILRWALMWTPFVAVTAREFTPRRNDSKAVRIAYHRAKLTEEPGGPGG